MTSCKIHQLSSFRSSVPSYHKLHRIGEYVGSVGSPNNLPIRDYNAFKLMRNIAPIDPSLPSDSRPDYCISIREGKKLAIPAHVVFPLAVRNLDDPCMIPDKRSRLRNASVHANEAATNLIVVPFFFLASRCCSAGYLWEGIKERVSCYRVATISSFFSSLSFFRHFFLILHSLTSE